MLFELQFFIVSKKRRPLRIAFLSYELWVINYEWIKIYNSASIIYNP